MDGSRAKELALRVWEEGWNNGDLDVVDEALGAEAVDRHQHGEADFRAHLKGVIREFRAGFPDLRATVEDLVGEGDRLAMRVVVTGTHAGTFFGVPATGRAVRIEQFHFLQVNPQGQGVRHWASIGIEDLFRQLGTTAPVPA